MPRGTFHPPPAANLHPTFRITHLPDDISRYVAPYNDSATQLNDISRYVVISRKLNDATSDGIVGGDVGTDTVGILRVKVEDVGVDGELEISFKVA